MAKIIDLRGAGGNLVLLGSTLTLPNSSLSATQLAGSLRYNPASDTLELCAPETSAGGATAWQQVWPATSVVTETLMLATPADGDTVTIPSGISNLLLSGNGPIKSLTIKLPSPPSTDLHLRVFNTALSVALLVVQRSDGSTTNFYNIPDTMPAGTPFALEYIADSGYWVGAGYTENPRKPPHPARLGVIASMHLRARFAPSVLASTANLPCTVSVIGDSHWTPHPGPNSISVSETIWETFKRHVRRSNPGAVFSFQSFAIGGSLLAQANPSNTTTHGIPLSFPSWYTDHSKTWLSYLKSSGNFGGPPDLMVIGLGFNDQGTFEPSDMKGVLDEIATWDPVPDIVWATPFQISIGPGGGGFADPLLQEVTRRIASYIRTFVYSKNAGVPLNGNPSIGLIDINRYYAECRDAQDYGAQYLQKVVEAPITGIAAFPYNLPASCDGDFDLQFTVPGGGTAFGNGTLSVEVFAGNNPGGSSLSVVQVGGTAGKFLYSVFAGNATFGINGASAGDAGTGDVVIQLNCKAENLLLVVNGETLFDGPVPRFIATFIPLINIVGTGTINLDYYNAGIATPCIRSLRDIEGVGPYDGSPFDTGIYGGNGFNHPSGWALSSIYERVFEESCDFCAANAGINVDVTKEQVITPTDGGTTQLADYTDFVVCAASGAIATHTLNLPVNADDDQELLIASTAMSITVVTVVPAAGQTLYGNSTATLTPTSPIRYRYVGASKSWVNASLISFGTKDQVVTPTEGGTTQVLDFVDFLICTGTTSLAAHTINLPVNAYDDQQLLIAANALTIGTVTLVPAAGQTLYSSTTRSLAPSMPLCYRYIAGSKSWLNAAVVGTGGNQQVVTLTDGGTTTIADFTDFLVCTGSGTLASYTINLPAHVADGQELLISSVLTVTSLTVVPASGQTFFGTTPTTLSPTAPLRYRYVAGSLSWLVA